MNLQITMCLRTIAMRGLAVVKAPAAARVACPVFFLLIPPGALDADTLPLPDSVVAFLDRQLDKFPVPGDYPEGFAGARLIQTFDLIAPGQPGASVLSHRADVYDSALAAIYYTRRGNLVRAQQLLDGIRLVQMTDPFADGRVRTSYWANDLLAPGNTGPSIDDPKAASGNNAWAGIALTRFYVAAGETGFLAQDQRDRYLEAARDIARWLDTHTRQGNTATDAFGGFSLGFDAADAPVFNTDVRSTEHNLDVFALGLNLAAVDPAGEARWLDMADHAQRFVQHMFDEDGVDDDGKYWIGTRESGTPGEPMINRSPIPTDTQAWTALARIDTEARAQTALDWLADPGNGLVTDDTVQKEDGTEVTLTGTRFTNTGAHIHSEATAGAAMALLLAGGTADATDLAAEMKDTLEIIRLMLPESDPDGVGILATPWPTGGLIEAGGDPILHTPHVASTVWTGLLDAFADGDLDANPFRPVPEPQAAMALVLVLVLGRPARRLIVSPRSAAMKATKR